jgi:ASC-1-like (ASCH) protein
LEIETLEKVLPGIKSIEEGVNEYYKFSEFKEGESKYGVIALQLKIIN